MKLKRAKPRKILDRELQEIRSIVDESHAALATPGQLVRFLCGMSSPATMRMRLYRHDGYGMLADLPFEHVKITAQSFFKKTNQ